MLEFRQLFSSDEEYVSQYLRKYLKETLELTGRFQKYGLTNTRLHKKEGDWYGVFAEGCLKGIFQFSNHHSMLCHYSDFEILKKVILLKTIRQYNPKNIMGIKPCIDPVYEMIAKSLRDVRYAECWQMFGEVESKGLSLKEGIIFEDAVHYDLNKAVDFLLEAEKSFGRKPRMINDLKMKITDREEQETYLFLVDQGKVVAQGAIEFHTDCYAQIGAVYTAQSARNKGYAFMLMNELMRRIYLRNLIPSLAVEKKNTAAIRLYKKLGFQKGDHWVALNLELD